MRRIKTNSLGARVLSGFLSLLMVVSACPVSAFADDNVDSNPIETTTIVVDENGVHTDGEDNDNYTIIVEDESDEDDNKDSIPGDEDAQDQNNPDVDTPPNIETGSDDGTDDENVIVVDQDDEDSDEEAEPTEETDVDDQTDEETVEDEEIAEPEYEYSVTLPSDKTVSEGDTLDIVAEVVAKVTVNEETEDVEYTFEFSGEGFDIEVKSATSAAITFNNAGDYTLVGKLIVEDEEVASDEMTVKVNPIVVFDHYFTEIDESLVETSDLLVKTSDSSVFTKNTNVVSNFDDVYIIECSSVEEARYVYSYYVDKVDSISDLSKVISIATDENDEDVADLDDLNDGNDALAQLNEEVENTETTDYSDYIALIDTGANDADVKFSVVGNDVNDSNGHGSRMLELIKGENPDAKVMSIKVFNGDKTDAASVYAGIKLAMANDVKIINLSLVGSDVEKNAIVKDVIQEAINNGIVVIGAAGNYNLPATKFIPGCIDDVIVIGAANEDGTKQSNSNYNVDYYVVADSTSEATAMYTGMYSAGITEDARLYTGDFTPTKPIELIDEYAWLEGIDIDYIINEDGTITFIFPEDLIDDFEPAAGTSQSHVTGKNGVYSQHPDFPEATSTSSSGTCTFAIGTAGNGAVSGFSGNSIFEKVWAYAGSPALYCSCERYWYGESDQSKSADYMRSGTKDYSATTVITRDDSQGIIYMNVDIRIKDQGQTYTINWVKKTTTYYAVITAHVKEHDTPVTTSGNKDYDIDASWAIYANENQSGLVSGTSGSINRTITASASNPSAAINQTLDGCKQDAVKNVSKIAETLTPGDFSGNKNVTHSVGSWTGGAGVGTSVMKAPITVSYDHTDDTQIYHAIFDAWAYTYVYVNLNKTFVQGANGSYYPDDYTNVVLLKNGSQVYDKDGRAVHWDHSTGYSTEYALKYTDYANTTLVAREDSVGFGYAYGPSRRENGPLTDTRTTGGGGSHTTFYLTNYPMKDAIALVVTKVSNNTGDYNPNGDITIEGAEYTLTGYNITTNCEQSSATGFTHVYRTNNKGRFSLDEVGALPMGYYELKETKAAPGFKINPQVFSLYILPHGCTPGNNGGGSYHSSNEVDAFFYLGSGHSGTLLARRVAPSNDMWGSLQIVDNDYAYNGNVNQLKLTNEAETAVLEAENEIWYPMGLIKADTDMNDYSSLQGNSVLGVAEGNGSYEGAVYQLFLNTNSSDYFRYVYNNPNGNGNNLTLGSGMTGIATEDGLGNAGYTTFADSAEATLYPVLYNGNEIKITTDANGFARASMLFPYGDDYRWVELKAPEGYAINQHVYKVSTSDWYADNNNHDTPQNLVTYTDSVALVRPTEEGIRDGATEDIIYRYGFQMYKKDLTFSTDALNNMQGSGSLDGIRYAVINRSNHHVVMRNNYNVVDGSYCAIKDGVEIGTDRICAIVTTHTVDGVQGCLRMYGLPYGKYDVVELKIDAGTDDALIGAAFTDQGSSDMANPSYLRTDTTVYSFDYTTEANKQYYGAGNIDHFTYAYAGQDGDHIYQDKIMVDGFQAYKLDEEYLEVTEGNSSANDIKFAVINRSTRTMEILQSDIDQLGLIDPNWASYVEFIPGGNAAYGVGNTDGQIAPGEVVAVITTHNGPEAVKEGTYAGQQVDGYFAIYGLPYGTYEVVELKRDANIHPGDVWETADKGNSIYANDSFYWNDTHFTYNLTDYNSHAHSVNGAFDVHKDLYSTGTSRYKDDVFRDGFSFWKRDLVYRYAPNEDGFLDHPQGDSTWNDIRYVVINKSDDNVKMFDKYTQQMPAADQPYVEIKNDVAIAPNCVVAIITSHQKSGNDDDELVKGYEQGYVALWGLPYGQYEIRELRADATIQVGDNYYESTKLGSSVFANYRVNSDLIGLRTDIANNPSMLYRDDIYFYYTLEDTKAEDGSDLHTGYTNNGRLIMMGDLHEVDDNNENTWDNETVYGNIIITKQDDETKIPGYNQGANSLAHVQFAVVNRSYWSVCYPYTEDLENAEDRYFEPDEVIAVLETDDTGTCRIDHLPYGTYEVYELRINNSYNTQQRTINLPNNSGQLVEVTCYGNTIKPHFVWNDAAMEAYKDWQKDYAAHEANTAVNGVAGQEGQYFGTDDRANEWYTWNEYINKYFVVQPEWRHEIGSGYDAHTEDDRTIRGYVGTTTNKQSGSMYEPQEYHFTWSDLPVRGDFKMQKANIDGDFMPYVPWLISLVESDANGDPIQNEDGSYNVIEEHVFVLDFDAMFDSRNWDARPKTVDNLNKYDDYVEFDPDLNKLVWTGSKEDLKAAATGNIWFGDIELENPNSKYVIKERGALLAGTYVIQEIPRVSKYGYPKFNDPGVNPEDAIEEVNLGNGKVRTIIWNTEDYDMISSTLRVVHDNPNPVLLPDDFDIGVDVPLTIQSEALDAIDETNSTIPSDHGLLRDTVTFGGLNTSQRYGYKTYIWRCDEDGNPIELLQETDMCTLDFTGSKYTNPTNNREYNTLRNADPNFTSVVSGTFTDDTGSYTIVDNNYVVFRDHDGNFTRESAPNNDPTNDRFNVLYNLSIIQDFNIDTSMCQEGEKIAFAVDLYKSMGASGWSLVKQHNAELNEKTQYVGIIKFVTESTDKTTRTRVAGLGGYAYGEEGMPLVNNAATSGQLVYNADGEIVGYTLVDDKIVYSNLGDKQDYSFRAELVGVNSAGETFVVKDIYGNECKTRLVSIYIDKDLDHVLHGTDIIDENGTPDDESDDVLVQGSLEGPCDGEFTFSDLGMMDWVIPNNPDDTISVFVRVELYNKRNICLKHHNYDLDEEDENIRWLQIKTTAMSEAGDEGVLPNGRSWDLDGNMIKGDVVLRDRIDYSNLAESVDIRVEGYVYLVGYDEEGKRFIDTNNGLDTPYVAYSSKNFTLTDVPEGSVEMQYTVKDSGQYAKRELVVCERVYMDLPGHAGVHADGKYVPENASMDSRSMIYICTDPNCGERFNTYGKAKIHQQATGHHFVQEIAYGTLDVSKYVLHDDGDTEVLIALHEDINDEKQTIVIPELHTEFIESHTDTHVVPLEEDATVTDTIHYKGLVPGKNYIMQCVLMNKTTGEPYYLTSTDDEGNTVLTKITEDKSFTASETGEGYVEISFTIPADQLHDFDYDLDKDHLNINRTVTDTGTAPEVDVDGNPVIEPTDVSGNDNTRVITNEYTGEEARAERGISDEEKINVTKSTQIVAFERCISDEENSRVYAIHADIEDEDQTILVPRIFTHLTDTVIGDHVSRWNTTETITDTVTFVSLQADKEYTIEGYLVNVDTGEPILVKDANGEDVRVTATKTFTPNTLPDTQVSISNGKLIASGNVDLVFTFDSTALKGTHVVAFEDCKYGEIKVATHAEIDDQWQWMFVPEIGTTANGYVKATDSNAEYREKVVPYGETAQLIDVVEYNKLLPGVWYEMSGTIMDKATGKAITDKDGKAVTATTRFLPAESSGKVEVIFTLDTTGLEGKTLVVFEECLYVGAKKDGTPNKEAVAEHKDIEDEDQTIYCPKIRTTVKDANGNTNVQLDGTKTQTIIDTVTYENLIPGKEYTVTGTLVFKRDYGDSKDYEYVKDANGNKITASTTFKPDESNSTIKDGLASGTVEVKFEFNAALTAGRRVVVFEDLYLEKVRVGTHSDINDENQTFDTAMKLHVKLVKSDFDNHVYVLKNAEISIYVDEKCTQLAKDINGNDCVGKTNEKGEVEFIIITYDENQLFYAKETKAPFGYKLCEDVIPIKGTAYYDGATNTKTTFTDNDMSRESDGVCAINLKMFDKIIIIPPKTGDNLPILPITILALIGLLCVGAFFATKRKKVVTDVDDTTDNVEEMDEEAVEDAITGMMTEEIDGDGHNDSGF